jgi:hypothetical protein
VLVLVLVLRGVENDGGTMGSKFTDESLGVGEIITCGPRKS